MSEWIKHASPKAKINAKDFAQLLDMPISTFWLHLKAGKIPPPDTKHIVGNTLGKAKTFVNKTFWNMETITQYLKTRSLNNVQR